MQSSKKNLKRQGKRDCNVRPSMVRNLLKATKLRKHVQDICCWNPKTEQEELMPLAFILPEEILSMMAATSEREVLMSTDNMDPLPRAHLAKCKASAGVDLLGIGIWGDGVPCQWDHTESADGVSFNLPGGGWL